MAAAMVAHGEETGALRPGMRVVEYTGGSTGSSLAMVCAARGYRAHLVTADCFALEKIRTMRAFGAEVEVLESDGGRVTPELFDRFKARIAELAEDPDTWWAEQFVNPGNAAGVPEHSGRRSWSGRTAASTASSWAWERVAASPGWPRS